MRFKIYYDKTLKMSPEKLASQVAHITLNLGSGLGGRIILPREQTIIVLGLNHSKFEGTLNSLRGRSCHTGIGYHVQTDLGLTEVPAGTITAFGYIE